MMRMLAGAAGRGSGLLCAARRLGPGLLKNTHNLRLKFREFHGEHDAAGMKDQIEARGQQIHVAAQGLAHAALDAVALMGLAQHLARGEADARPQPEQLAPSVRLRRQKPAHGCGLPLAAGRIGALIVGVLAQARRPPGIGAGQAWKAEAS